MKRGTSPCYWLEPIDKKIILANLKRKGMNLSQLYIMLNLRSLKRFMDLLDGKNSLTSYQYWLLKKKGLL